VLVGPEGKGNIPLGKKAWQFPAILLKDVLPVGQGVGWEYRVTKCRPSARGQFRFLSAD